MNKFTLYIKSRCFIVHKVFFITLFIFIMGKGYAQTEPMYSQYMYNMLGINPAYAGSREALSLNFFQRNQWVGLRGAPKTTSVSIDQLVSEGKMGWGVQIYNDQLGVESANGANFQLATRVRISDNGILSAGLSVGLMNYQINLNNVENRFTPFDPTFTTLSNPSQWNPSVGLGIYYNTDKFYAGISSPSVLKSRLAKYENFNSGIQKNDDFHLFATMGYVLDLTEDVQLKPSTLFKIVSGAPIEMDFNANIWMKNIVSVGASYRTGDALVGLAEIQANRNVRFGYAYDMPFSPLKYYTKGTHELMVRYEFGNAKIKIKSTRYF